jgi:hypothetical protein
VREHPEGASQGGNSLTDKSLARSPRTVTTEQEEAHHELLEAAKSALSWFDLYDEHAPDDWIFGGEAKVRRQLRRAIKRQHA